MIWYNITWYDMIQYNMIWYDTIHIMYCTHIHGTIRGMILFFFFFSQLSISSGLTPPWILLFLYQIALQNTVFRDFPAFSRTCIFSLLTFSLSDLVSSDFHPVWASSWLCLFHLSILSEAQLLNLLRLFMFLPFCLFYDIVRCCIVTIRIFLKEWIDSF